MRFPSLGIASVQEVLRDCVTLADVKPRQGGSVSIRHS